MPCQATAARVNEPCTRSGWHALGRCVTMAQGGQHMRRLLPIFVVTLGAFGQGVNHDLGYDDTPMLPGLPFHVHDPKRPHPPVVIPSAQSGGAPSDALVLFDGKDLSQWEMPGKGNWKLANGVLEVTPGSGDLATKQKFGDVQLHVE